MRTYNLEISVQKSKTMAFIGKEIKGTKLILNDKPIEQVNKFNFYDVGSPLMKKTISKRK